MCFIAFVVRIVISVVVVVVVVITRGAVTMPVVCVVPWSGRVVFGSWSVVLVCRQTSCDFRKPTTPNRQTRVPNSISKSLRLIVFFAPI